MGKARDKPERNEIKSHAFIPLPLSPVSRENFHFEEYGTLDIL